MVSKTPWWTSDFPELVAKRDVMPGVERWQTQYARYRRFSEAQVVTNGIGWDLNCSRRNYEQLVRTEAAHFLPDDHLLFSNSAPETVNMRISEAPAEFGVPVKQDRRLIPNFKVKVEVKYKHQLSLPLKMKAYIIAQPEKDNIMAWSPEESDLSESDKKPITELKGSDVVTHHFEANLNSGSTNAMGMSSRYHQAGHLSLDRPWDNRSFASDLNSCSLGGIKTLGITDIQQILDFHPGNTTLLLDLYQQPEHRQVMEQLVQQQQKMSSAGFFSNMDPMLLNHANNINTLMGHSTASMCSKTLLGNLSGVSQCMGSSTGSTDLQTMVHEFSFENLEFVKPTRMTKVYIVFACTILEMDTLFCVYNIPTIGICRAEQRKKACQTLGIPTEMLPDCTRREHHDVHHRKRDADRQAQYDSEDSEGIAPPIPLDMYTAAPLPLPDAPMNNARSRQAMREWLLEEYDSTGLTRRLTTQDLQALLSQAGFPMDAGSDHACISQQQWDEVVNQYCNVLNLLRTISMVWNLEDPCIISGFDMDRAGTVQALAKEPAGTFVCRFSLSQPGCLVLSCKTVQGTHAKADRDHLVHAIIRIDDLNEKRVDTWILGFAGATHVLDVYRQKRVDKRKVFSSNYTRIRGLEGEGEGEGTVNGVNSLSGINGMSGMSGYPEEM